jgi:hypothetical protein
MQLRLLLAAILLWAGPAFAQYARADFSLTNAQGQAISGAQVYVLQQPNSCSQVSGSQYTCASFTPLQTLYGSATGSGTAQCGGSAGQIMNPQTTDGFGHACAYIAPGAYMFCYYSTSTGTICFPDQSVYSSSGAYCSISGCTYSGTVTAPGFVGPLTGHASLDLPLTGGTVASIETLPKGVPDVKAFGATGNGSTDDTAAINRTIAYENTTVGTGTGYVIFPPGHYKTTACINMCQTQASSTAACTYPGGIQVWGYGPNLSVIAPDVTSSPSCVLDFGGSTNSSIHQLGIVDVSGDTSISGVISSHGNQSGVQGDGFYLEDATVNLQHSSATAAFPLVFCATDTSYLKNDVNLVGGGNGSPIVVGDYLSPAATNVVFSPFYTLANTSTGFCNGNNGFTHFNLGDNNSFTSEGNQPAIYTTSVQELDGGRNLYATNDGTGAGAIVEFDSRSPELVSIAGLRTEYHGSDIATSTAAGLYFTGASYGGSIIGVIDAPSTAAGAAMIGGSGIFNHMKFNLDGGAYQLWNLSGSAINSEFLMQVSTPSPAAVPGVVAVSENSLFQTTEALTPTQLYSAITTDIGNTTTCGGNGSPGCYTWSLLLGSTSNYGTKLISSLLTSARTFTLPDANSNSVQPSTCTTGQSVTGISSAGVLSCATSLTYSSSAAMTSGTVTFTTSTACAVGSTCHYQINNCGAGGTVGSLSLGTITPGTSFTVNSTSALDTSTVCAKITSN